MSNIIKISSDEREDGSTKDAIKYNKDCMDFQCLDDGTIVGECKYCNLSIQCRQIDILPNGEAVGMEAHYLPVLDSKTGELVSQELFCTGKYDLRPRAEKLEDDKVS